MSIRRSNLTPSTKEFISNSNKNRRDDTENEITHNNEEKIEDNRPKLKVDYKSSNYFYNDVDYYKEYPYKRMDFYFNTNENKRKYNIESNSSHITVENEDGYIKYIPNKNYNYNNYNDIPTQKNNNYIEISSHKNEYYDDNSEYSENNDNENLYYDNEEYENGIINSNSNSPDIKYNQYRDNINFYLAPNKVPIKKKNQNIISKAITHEIHFSSDKNMKIRPLKKKIRNCGNNTTTTNNTYNNNIYYINPINLKNKNKMKEKNNIINSNNNNNINISNNKIKKYNSSNNNITGTNRKNLIYKGEDIALQKRRLIRERDYFKINNIDKAKRDLYIKAIILIQSIFRGYLVKIKLYNNVNLYLCCKNAIDILEEILFNKKNEYWKIYKNNITSYKPVDSEVKPSLSIRSKYKLKNNKIKESLLYHQYHKELGDSFNIINNNVNRENNEKKLKSKLDNVIKENNVLKNQLMDNKNLEVKLKLLLDENKKNQNINAIIMKDNQQLAKKLKDVQDYRNHKLLIENQYSLDLNKLKLQELSNDNEMYIHKLKKALLSKILYKKINHENNVLKGKISLFRNIVDKLNNKDIENKFKKEVYLKNLVNIIEKHIKLLINKYFRNLYYNGLLLEKDKNIKKDNINMSLKKLIYIFEQKNKIILNNMFFKFINNIKYNNNELNEEEKKRKREEILEKLFIKYDKNAHVIYKVIMEKWNLLAKIIGIKTAARDKKKKRKQKKKNNRLLYNQKFALTGNKNNYGPKFCKSIHEFSYIVSNGTIIKESSSNEQGRVLLSNKSTNNINISKNNLDDKDLKKKKTKSVNKRNIFKDKKENIDINKDNINIEESDEDSGDSFGLENNSD